MTETYEDKRSELLTYLDENAADTWEALTADIPVTGVRATVELGRQRMRDTLISQLPETLSGTRILDAGCGTGTMTEQIAQKGADVVGVDLSKKMINIAANRHGSQDLRGSIEFVTGDMLDDALGSFDYAIAMDSLMHYDVPHLIDILESLVDRVSSAIYFTITPKAPSHSVMNSVSRLFAQDNKLPPIQPIMGSRLVRLLNMRPRLKGWRAAQHTRIKSGFYFSEAISLTRIE